MKYKLNELSIQQPIPKNKEQHNPNCEKTSKPQNLKTSKPQNLKTSNNMLSELSQKSVSQIFRLMAANAPVGQKWSSEPWFQRDAVWDLKRKQKLIDSLKKGMPFGMVWTWTHVVDGVSVTDIIDGKQRCTTLVAFMNGQFRDEDGKLWSEWTEREQARAETKQVAVQGVQLEDGETEWTVVELFRRINTQSKQLTPGQLLKSCEQESVVKFLKMVFLDDLDEEGPFSEQIAALRERWAAVFCKEGFKIKTNASHGELTFLSGVVVPLLTGKNEAITTSFDILNLNGLRDAVSDEMKAAFFEKMLGEGGFLEIVQSGWEENQFKRSAKGYPTFVKITPILYLVNQAHIARTSAGASSEAQDCAALVPHVQEFFEKLDDDEDLEDDWKVRFRKNRNIENLRLDVQFIRDTISNE